MEPTYSDWKKLVNAHKQYVTEYCPYCEQRTAYMMLRYHTNRDGETERQYRIECPICQRNGKTYIHQSVAEMSWQSREGDPNRDEVTDKRSRTSAYLYKKREPEPLQRDY